MKVRWGFVSNSSSSSFILPMEEDKFILKLSLEDLKSIIESSYYSDTKIKKIITNENEAKEYVVSLYGWNEKSTFEDITDPDDGDSEYAIKRFKDIMEYINAGRSVVVGNIENNEMLFQNIIRISGGKIDY